MATRYRSQTEACKTERVIEKFGDGLLLCINMSSVTQFSASDLLRENNVPSVSSAS